MRCNLQTLHSVVCIFEQFSIFVIDGGMAAIETGADTGQPAHARSETVVKPLEMHMLEIRHKRTVDDAASGANLKNARIGSA